MKIPLAVLNLTMVLLSQLPIPIPDSQGNYYSNEAPVKGQASPRLMAGSLWKVVTTTLNCRQTPNINSPIIQQFKQGDILQAEVYRGGSDEVLINAKDSQQLPWMPVRRYPENNPCYVRANQRYIQPMSPSKNLN